MSGSASRRIPANQVGLVFLLLLAAWLVFLYFPRRKEPPPPMVPVMAESKLRSVGLADNPDWEGLPEFFAIVADKAEWKDGRTRFAYWHPVMKTYSYYFEATRDGASFRFKEIAEPKDLDYVWEESLGDGSQIRFYYSASSTIRTIPVPPNIPTSYRDLAPPEKAARPDSIKVPPVDLKLQPPDIGKKR